jgi:hypothetical protein
VFSFEVILDGLKKTGDLSREDPYSFDVHQLPADAAEGWSNKIQEATDVGSSLGMSSLQVGLRTQWLCLSPAVVGMCCRRIPNLLQDFPGCRWLWLSVPSMTYFSYKLIFRLMLVYKLKCTLHIL